MTKPKHQDKDRPKLFKVGINALIVVLLIILIISQWSNIETSIKQLSTANPLYFLSSFCFIMITFIFAALQYKNLAIKKIKFVPTYLVQLSGALINRLFPAGIGGIGLNLAFLKKQRHSITQASIVISINNILGFLTLILLALIVLILWPSTFNLNNLTFNLDKKILIGFILLIIATAIFILLGRRFIKNHLNRFKKDFTSATKMYRNHPSKLILASLMALGLNICYVFALLLAANALAPGHINFGTALVVMSVGVISATITPTPGGLVGAEAGLAASLMVYGFSAPESITIAITYRLASYWLPMIVGALAYTVTLKKKYIAR